MPARRLPVCCRRGVAAACPSLTADMTMAECARRHRGGPWGWAFSDQRLAGRLALALGHYSRSG